MKIKKTLSLIVPLLLVVGCSESVKEEFGGKQAEHSAVAEERLSLSPSTDGKLFQHGIEKSRFDVGAASHVESGSSFERTLGNRGAFFVDKVTGAVLAVPNSAPAPVEKSTVTSMAQLPSPPEALTENSDEHSAVVRGYFVEAGLPETEIGGTHVTTTMSRMGPVDGSSPAVTKFLWYTSHMERKISGVRVEGSAAYAALDKAGRAISESVYWPAIPADVVAAAVAWKERLRKASERDAFLAVARSSTDFDVTTGEVVIAHTRSSYHGKFEARPIYTAISLGTAKRSSLRFNEQGARVRLPDELPSGLSDTGTR